MARTVLHDIQRAGGGRMVDFHGWDMAVQFSGITAEHQAVRTAVGAFDLGHMGRVLVDGPGAAAFLARRVCRRIDDQAPGSVRYGLVLAADGTVEDDVLVSRESATSFHVVVNASNKDKVLGLWRDAPIPGAPAPGATAPGATASDAQAVRIRDISAEQGMIAVQGPGALALLAGLGLDGRHLRYYAFADAPWRGTTVRLSRTGYTGEDGCECFLPTDRVVELWRSVIAGGALPCGLGARDTLRTEAGMPLYGNELDRSVTPVEAGLGFAVNQAGGFIGAEVVLRRLAEGPARKLVGLTVPGKRVPRHGYGVIHGGATVGAITSGTLSPTLGQAIGMAYVPTTLSAPGTAVMVDIRGIQVGALVTTLPFYKRPRQ